MKMTHTRLIIFSIAFSLIINLNAQFQQGRDYERIPNPLPIKQDNKVEVIEVFWYGCGHCYSFDPVVNKWADKLGKEVTFKKLPVVWGPVHELHAKLYYTIEALGIGDTAHAAVFTSIHRERNFLSNNKAIVQFLVKLGIEESEINKTMNSFSVKQKVKRANELSKRLAIRSVPMMFVDGLYRVQVKGSQNTMLDTVDYLVEMQKPNS
tara:strand:+ start:3510 stop:4133 length:624 start_codon:yes stop_codon:yes gene_type:complete